MVRFTTYPQSISAPPPPTHTHSLSNTPMPSPSLPRLRLGRWDRGAWCSDAVSSIWQGTAYSGVLEPL